MNLFVNQGGIYYNSFFMQKQQKILDEYVIESSSEEFQILDSAQILKQSGQSIAQISPTISIKLNGVYIVIPHEEAQAQYANEQEWNQLLSKKFGQRKSQISVIGLNSIIGIDKQFSKRIWNKMITELSQQQKYICDDQAEFSIKIIKQVQKNVQKMFKRIGAKQDKDLQYAKTLITHTISLYQLREPHLGVLKGLQYICYGIFRCFDKKTAPQIYDSFAYLMVVQGLREVFYNSSQLFYAELDQLCEDLQMEVPKLYQYLVEAQADWSMIFVSYYRSLLLYGIQSEIVARTILDLIAVYGIQIIRIILVRIISKRQEELLQMKDPQKIMAILGTSLISHEFEPELERQRGKKNKKHEKQENKQIPQNKCGQEDKKEKEKNENWQKVVEKFKRIIIGI